MASTASAVRGGQVTTGSAASTRGGGGRGGGGESGSAGTAKLSKRGSKQDVVITGKLTPSSTSRTAVQGGSGRKRMKINSAFWGRLKRLLRILFPRFFSKPVLLLSLHSTYLVARTLVSIYVAQLDGQLVRALVERKGGDFIKGLLKWCAVGLGATFINSMLKFLEAKVAISFRTALTEHALKKYTANDTYYRVVNLDGRLTNADQCLTEDIWQFCKLLAHLYSHLSKPLLDVALISYQLTSAARARGSSSLKPALIAAFAVWSTSSLLKLASPPFGRLVKQQAEKAGAYRYVHSRLITNSEEIAFFSGDQVELNGLRRAYNALVKHMNKIYRLRVPYNMLEGFLLKYLWSAAGYMMVAYPAFYNESGAETTASERTQNYIVSRGLLTNAADAVERIMSSYKEITELAGYTYRVTDMLQVFDSVAAGRYSRGVDADTGAVLSGGGAAAEATRALLQARGTRQLSNDGSIEFDDVPIVSPIGDTLVKHLNFCITRGMHTLITGPNGCGKSSLFRILGGLWPLHGGRLRTPARSDIFYVPQKPYLCLGTLREQIIYPDTKEDMQKRGFTDRELDSIMDQVALLPIVEREGGWDAEKAWMDVLSGGEKQRVGMARVFYHKPTWAILDECTSAVSIDVEGRMYTHAKDLGVSLLTVTHRPSLWKYHDYLLQFDGEGGFTFRELNEGTFTSLQAERDRLREQLADVPGMQRRLVSLNGMLGAGGGDGGGSDSDEEGML